MKKNLLNKDTATQSIERVKHLQNTSAPLWGSMTITAMLNHLNSALRATLEGEKQGKPSNMRQQAIKFAMLNFLPKFPKHARAPSRLLLQTDISSDHFEKEKQQLIDLINHFSERQIPIVVTHPVFGRMNNKQWGILTWMHLDHHLRQFGV